MNALAELAREVLQLAVLVALPLGGAAVLGGIVSAFIGQLTGLQDAALGIVLRMLAVAGALILLVPLALPALTELVGSALAHLVVLGQEGL